MWPFLNKVTTTCGCTHCTPSTSICYTGVNLSCIGVNKNDTLSVALQKINALMCVPITNTEIITALGYTPANDSNVVHKTGNETIAGVKTFLDTLEVLGVFYVTDSYLQNGTVIIGTDANDLPFIKLGTNGMDNSIEFRIDNVNSNSIYQLPDASGTIALEETIKPYKVYTALLSQTGTNPPTAIVLENTLGTITFAYNAIGDYSINSSGLFTVDKTILFIQGSNDGDINSVNALDKLYYNTSSTINCITNGASNGMLRKTSIEIRVYN